jgi:3D (Asp-Asp-Asp) domain-containing protein
MMRWVGGALVAVVMFIVIVAAWVVSPIGSDSGGNAACAGAGAGAGTSGGADTTGSGSWLATAYGPPWGGIQGNGVTATGLDLTAGQPAYEVAVDPSVIPLRSWVHVSPNPFGTSDAFYAGDTGGAIIGRHVDIYDWKGRTDQNAWGERQVDVTPAADPGTGNVLNEIEANAGGTGAEAGGGPADAAACAELPASDTLTLVPGDRAQILPDGTAAAPADAPVAVKLAIAAANRIIDTSYSQERLPNMLTVVQSSYDCSGSTDFVLANAGLSSPQVDVGDGIAGDSGLLESYGDPGPGQWITLYANTNHVWLVIAGLAFDTADFGGPDIPAGSGPRWRSDPLGNQADGAQYVPRHPTGL